jgi:hypothetical protein
MQTTFWKCPHCDTINSGTICEHCQYAPQTPIIIDLAEPDTFASTPRAPAPDDSTLRHWACPNCQTKNLETVSACAHCGAKRNQKTHKTWLVWAGCVALVCVCIIPVSVVAGTYYWYAQKKPLAVVQPAPMREAPTENLLATLPAATEALLPSRKFPDPPIDGCTLWSSITIDDAGKTRCVFGLVSDSYKGDVWRFYVRFGDSANAFRFVLMGGLRPSLKPGQCVYQTGMIKAYADMPFMELSEMVLFCE